MSVSASGDYGVVAATTGREKLNLTGGLVSHLTLQPDNPPFLLSRVTWLFAGADVPGNSIERGQAQRAGRSSNQATTYISANIGTDWVIPNDFQDGPYFIRAQHDTTGLNVAPTGNVSSVTNPIGTADNPVDWLTLENGVTNRFWEWQTNGDAFNESQGIIKVEISTTQSEAGIVATGLYTGIAIAEQ